MSGADEAPAYYVERLASGKWGVYLRSGRRVAIRDTRTEAERRKNVLVRRFRKGGR